MNWTKNGFLLLELMVAFSVLTIISLIFASCIVTMRLDRVESLQQLKALELAQSRLEQIYGGGLSSRDETEGIYHLAIEPSDWKPLGKNQSNASLSIRVHWNDLHGNGKKLTLTSCALSREL